ncbi:MAG: hypothetical protein C4348_00140 [Patescibacteria group bacterium]
MTKRKPLIYATLLMSFLIFLWWLSGGSLIYGIHTGPAPIAQVTAFVFKNFQLGLSLIFNSLADFLGR